MAKLAQQAILNFYRYPSVGEEDWRYAHETAVVRSLEAQLLSRASFVDMAGAADFESAADMLSSGPYGTGQKVKNIAQAEQLLTEKRTELRSLFTQLIIDEDLIEPLSTREDFANMRLALRRKLTEKPLGKDYSNEGSVPAEQFEEIFEQENYAPLPEHMQQAIERAVLAYYQNKDIRQIDYALDAAHAEYKIKKALELENKFILELFRMQIDLINIRSMLRLKFTESENRDVFLAGGYVEHGRLKQAIDAGYEAIGQMFFATPYYEVVESGCSYLSSQKSFLRLEYNCEEHLQGYLRTAFGITSGHQPIIGYLLIKECEIRRLRIILTAKANSLDKRLILDRLGE